MHLSRLSPLFLIGLIVTGLSFATQSQAATTTMTMAPATATVASGHTQTFVVKAVDNDGTSRDVTSDAVLSTNDPKGKIIGATYTAGKAGTWMVQASYQSFMTTATTTVTAGDLAEIVVNPNSEPEIILDGTTRKFSAEGFDANSNAISGLTFIWSVIGTIGKIDAAGVLTSSQIGTGKVQAQAGVVTGQVAVEVRQAPATNTNTATSTNGTSNVNRSTNNNTNTATNANKNTNALNTNTSTTAATTTCTSLKPWLWTLILIIFLIIVAVLYGLVSVTKIWPVIVALVGAGILAYLQRKYDCDLQSWWAWVITLGTVALTALAIRSNPMNGEQKTT